MIYRVSEIKQIVRSRKPQISVKKYSNKKIVQNKIYDAHVVLRKKNVMFESALYGVTKCLLRAWESR
jgi:hypothetical protein